MPYRSKRDSLLTRGQPSRRRGVPSRSQPEGAPDGDLPSSARSSENPLEVNEKLDERVYVVNRLNGTQTLLVTNLDADDRLLGIVHDKTLALLRVRKQSVELVLAIEHSVVIAEQRPVQRTTSRVDVGLILRPA